MNPVSIQIASEDDVASARFEAREIARNVGFGAFEQTLISMAISELARNMLSACKGGTIKVEAVASDSRKGVRVLAITEGAEVKDGADVGSSAYTGAAGLTVGLAGVQRLMDEFSVETDDDRRSMVEVLKWV